MKIKTKTQKGKKNARIKQYCPPPHAQFILCWFTPGNGPCPEVYVLYLVTLHWKKLVFSLQVHIIASSFLVRCGTPCPLALLSARTPSSTDYADPMSGSSLCKFMCLSISILLHLKDTVSLKTSTTTPTLQNPSTSISTLIPQAWGKRLMKATHLGLSPKSSKSFTFFMCSFRSLC